MGKAVTYYILALAIILGLTYMASQAESCNQKSVASIHANDLSADKPDKPTTDDLEDDEPFDEENDMAGQGSVTSDEDADDDEVIPIEGDEEEYNDTNSETEAAAAASNSSSNYGDYLVIAGAFKQKANANAEVDRLQSSGYPNAEIVEFDYSDYYSVCVAKYDNRSDANAVANSIKSRSGKKAYVHKKREKK